MTTKFNSRLGVNQQQSGPNDPAIFTNESLSGKQSKADYNDFDDEGPYNNQ